VVFGRRRKKRRNCEIHLDWRKLTRAIREGCPKGNEKKRELGAMKKTMEE
jgi:hypothetical protein